MVQDQNALVWMDLEMTGLNPDEDRIIEIATIVTDGFLNIVAEGPNLAIKQPQSLLDGMDEWNTRTHSKSGLVARVINSNITEQMADQQTVDFLREYVPKGKAPLCGNSITQDRRFLYRYMPLITDYLHYRNVDVTSIKELGVRWDPDAIKKHTKNNTHLALDDIRESIDELKFYRRKLFK